MSFSIVKKSTRRTIGLVSAVSVTGIIIFGFLSTYKQSKNKAVPKVDLVQAAIYTESAKKIPLLYEAVVTPECIKQITFDAVTASSSSIAAASSVTSLAASSFVSLSSIQQSANAQSSKSSRKKTPMPPEPPLINASSPKCLTQTAVPLGYEKLGADGAVTLSLNLAETGRVERGEIETSSGFADLDFAALKQVTESWQFEPCKKADKIVACKQFIRFRWQVK